MRKTLILCAAFLMAVASCNSGKEYTVKGNISGDSEYLVNGKAYLYNRDKQNPIRDTVDVINGQFEFRGSVTTPEPYLITVGGLTGMVSIFLENDDFTITGVDSLFSQSTVTGGDAQTRLTSLNDEINALAKEYSIERVILKVRLPSTLQEERDSLMKIYMEFQGKCDSVKSAAMAEDPVSDLSLYFLNQDFFDVPLDSVEFLVSQFKTKKKFDNNRVLKEVSDRLDKELSLQPGKPCFDFTMNDPQDQPITFSDIYKANKVTMLDFWASWCNPCRMFNPTLVEIYKKYHDQGFEILGVSFDRDKKSWVNGIETDKLTWPQVSDLKFWENAVGRMYNVYYIPQNIFVDSEGNIIGRKVAEEDIESFLDEHLK